MASTISLPLPSPLHSSLVYELHPDLGDYVYDPSIDLWTNRRITSEGHGFCVTGRSRRPSEEQVQLWRFIEARLEELVAKAIAAIQAPPALLWKSRFSREELSLMEVRMESGGETEFYFDSPLCDRLNVGPMTTFLGLDLQGWDWVA